MFASLRRPAALAVVGLALGACSAGAGASSPPAGSSATGGLTIATATDASLGTFLTGADGKTLYVLTRDGPNQTTCTDSCAQAWPPLASTVGQRPQAGSGVTGQLGTLTRPDGTVQVTYAGHPLYYYSGDLKAGDTSGQGKGGVWFVAPASGALPATSSPATETPSPSPSKGRYTY